MILNLSDGKSIADAYKEYYISTLIGSKRWRRDLIKHWTTTIGSPLTTVNGKQYWGGAYSLHHLNDNEDMIRMADLLGLDETAKNDINDGTWGLDYAYTYFRPKAKTQNPYDSNNVAYMFEHGVAPKAVTSGLSTVVFKSIDIVVPCVFTNNVLDDPLLHIPAALSMKSVLRTADAYHTNFSITNTTIDSYTALGVANYNALGASKLGDVFSSIYSICNFFEQFCSNSITVEYVNTNYGFLGNPESWVFRTHHTFTMGDYSWITDNNVRDFLYPSIVIGTSADTDYFNFTVNNQMRGGNQEIVTGKNLSGKIMDVVDPATTGNGLLSLVVQNPYSWSIISDGKLWVEYDYIMNMEIKEFMQFINRHLDIAAGKNQGGFWGTFVGGFVGFTIKVFSSVIDLFFRIVEYCDIILKPIIIAWLSVLHKLGIISKTDQRQFLKAYKVIRNYVVLAVVTMGIGAYIQAGAAASSATAAGATAAQVATISAYDVMAFELMHMTAAQIATHLIAMGVQIYTQTNVQDIPDMTAQSIGTSESHNNAMAVVYDSEEMDYIDAVYAMMGDLGMSDLGANVLDVVYS